MHTYAPILVRTSGTSGDKFAIIPIWVDDLLFATSIDS